LVLDGSSDRVKILDSFIGKSEAEVVGSVTVDQKVLRRRLHDGQIVGVNALLKEFSGRRSIQGAAVDVERFLRPVGAIGTSVPRPAAGMSELLGFGETCLAEAHCVLGALAVLDVGPGPVPPGDVTRCIAQRHSAKKEPAVFAVCRST